MTVEASVTYISDLDKTYPAEGEVGTLHEGNDHIRNIKKALDNTFPNVTGEVTSTHIELNYVDVSTLGTMQASKALTASSGNVLTVQNGGTVNIASGGVLQIDGTAITASAAELNILDGVTAEAAELNILDGVTVTTAQLNAPVLMTAKASTSGTAIDFTDIPAWAKRITVMLAGVSTNGTDSLLIQIGDSGGYETAGYVARRGLINSASGGIALIADLVTSGFDIAASVAAGDTFQGVAELVKLDGNTWALWSNIYATGSNIRISMTAGYKTLSAALDRVQVITTDTFDAGMVNILYE